MNNSIKILLQTIFYLFKQIIRELEYFLIDRMTRLNKIRKYRDFDFLKLNLGSGRKKKIGLINIDLIKNSDLRSDLRRPILFKNKSVIYIYSEHFFEHLDYINGTTIKA